jgi:hypothetical protein
MTEQEWNLKREVLNLRMELAKAQAQLLQRVHDDAAGELQTMGDKWPDEAKADVMSG